MSKYILSFDPHKSDAKALHGIIKNSSLIKHWSHYLASSYVLVSDATATELTRHITSQWPSSRFIVIEINASNRNGWMPSKAWDWFKKHK